MSPTRVKSLNVRILSALALLLMTPQAWCATSYLQTNLVSNIPGLAQSTDPNLKNPWGNSFSATSPFWVANTGSNTSTLYQGTGSTVNARVVVVGGGPTGTVANASTTSFIESNGRAGSFLFSSLDGSIYSWNASDTSAQQVAKVANARFTGLALANNGSGDFLYATNDAGNGSIEVFNSSFVHVTPSGSFTDPNVPVCRGPFCSSAYVPFNIQNINGQLYVEYANFKLGLGAVSVFDANGNFIKSLIPAGTPQLNLPWGVVLAPAGFGSFAGALLVGNFGNGVINAFDAANGTFLGTVGNANGPFVNAGLWSLSVRTGGTFDTNAIYFTAGINGEADGLFGKLTVLPDSAVAITTPSSLPAGKIGTAYTQSLLAAGGVQRFTNWTITTGSLPPGVSLNSATGVISGTPVSVGGTFYFTVSVSDGNGTTGSAAFQLTIEPSTTAGLNRIGSFAQIASGGVWKTTLTLTNSSAVAVTAKISFYEDDGTLLSLPVSVPKFSWNTSAQSLSLILNPNDTVTIESSAATSPVGAGWADVQATGALTASSKFALSLPGSPVVESTAPMDTRLASSVVLSYDNTNGLRTGVALASQSSTATTVTATLFDANGAQVASSQFSMTAFGHAAFFTTTLFAQAANQKGTIQFQSSGGIAGVDLSFTPTGSFTSIPIVR